jgi:hypothetical protein
MGTSLARSAREAVIGIVLIVAAVLCTSVAVATTVLARATVTTMNGRDDCLDQPMPDDALAAMEFQGTEGLMVSSTRTWFPLGVRCTWETTDRTRFHEDESGGPTVTVVGCVLGAGGAVALVSRAARRSSGSRAAADHP